MKRLLHVFVLTPPEQRIVIVLVLLLVLGAWFKHHRDVHLPQPQGAAISKSPSN